MHEIALAQFVSVLSASEAFSAYILVGGPSCLSRSRVHWR